MIDLNPNCSECIFALKGLSRDEAIAALNAIGIFEVTIPVTSNYDGKTYDHVYLADKDNELLPNFDEHNGNLDLDEWAVGVCVHGDINLGDYAYPTMLKIQKAFPQGSWEDINGSEVEEFLQWYMHDMPPVKTKMDEKTKRIREKYVNPQIKQKTELNPNCSEIVFKLPGITREQALAKLRDIGILEVTIPLKLFSRDNDDDISWTILADRDNPLVPDLDSEYGGAQLDIETWQNGETVIHGGINLEYSAFPTMKKIRDAFPASKWEEAMGGDTAGEFEEWLNNGMRFTARQKKAVKFGRKKPGKDTRKARKEIIDPAFAALNPVD
ncbi:MAG: hypothetical protein Q6353_019075 [Candidatus Sigynarchaeum springense]